MAAIPTSFDGLSVNGVTDYALVLHPAGQDAPLVAGLVERRRLYQTPRVDAVAHEARRVPFVLYLKPDAATAAVDFRADVHQYFTPQRRGTRTILATHPDGSTTLTAAVYVSNLSQTSYNAFRGELVFPDGVWKATSTSSDSSSPATVAGEHPAPASLAIAMTTGTLARRRIQIDDECTRGLSNYPVLITFDSQSYSATTAANYVVMNGGRAIPFKIVSPDNASTKIWVRVDVPPSGSAYLDLYYGSALNNTVTADALQTSLDTSNSSNTSWVWANPFTVSTNPRGACGEWVAVKGGRTTPGVRFGIQAEAATQLDIAVAPDASGGALANDADAIALVIGTGAGTSNALSAGLTLDDFFTGSGCLMFIKSRTAGQVGWTTVYSNTALPPGGPGAQDIDNAVELLIGLEATAATADGYLRFGISGTFSVALNSALTPTVTVGSAVAARRIDGVITNTTTGDTITFDEVYLDDGATLTIDSDAETVSISSGPLHTAGSGIVPSNPPAWFELALGSNSWTVPSGVTMTVNWQERYYA